MTGSASAAFGIHVSEGAVLGLHAGATLDFGVTATLTGTLGLGPEFPPSFQATRVYGRFVGSDGAPTVGKISFVPDPDALVVFVDGVTVVPTTLTATLDDDGAFSVYLPATDDPDVNPTRWTYRVNESWGAKRSYHIDAPLGPALDILTVAPVPSSIGIVKYRGPKGDPGDTGPAGVNWQGVWDITTQYVLDDGVRRGKDSYVSLTSNLGSDPATHPADWQLFAQGGVDGLPGTANLGAVVLSGPAPSAGQTVIADGPTAAHWGAAPEAPGFIRWWAGDPSDPPAGYLVADGTEVDRTAYAGLFAVIGERFGSGDGSTTFNLPDLIEMFPRGSTSPGGLGGAPSHVHGPGTLAAASHTHSGPSHTHTFDDNGHVHDLTDNGQAKIMFYGPAIAADVTSAGFTASRRKPIGGDPQITNIDEPTSVGLQGQTNSSHADGTTAAGGTGSTGATAPGIGGATAGASSLPPYLDLCPLIKA